MKVPAARSTRTVQHRMLGTEARAASLSPGLSRFFDRIYLFYTVQWIESTFKLSRVTTVRPPTLTSGPVDQFPISSAQVVPYTRICP